MNLEPNPELTAWLKDNIKGLSGLSFEAKAAAIWNEARKQVKEASSPMPVFPCG